LDRAKEATALHEKALSANVEAESANTAGAEGNKQAESANVVNTQVNQRALAAQQEAEELNRLAQLANDRSDVASRATSLELRRHDTAIKRCSPHTAVLQMTEEEPESVAQMRQKVGGQRLSRNLRLEAAQRRRLEGLCGKLTDPLRELVESRRKVKLAVETGDLARATNERSKKEGR
jgi:hypothetical protein